jgi:hypothetical protein
MTITQFFRLLIFTFAVSLVCACHKDEPCTVQYEQSPELRGFRLGMSISDIQRRFPGFPTPGADDLGLATVGISERYSSNAPQRRTGDIVMNVVNASLYPELNQLKYAELKLLDGQLVEITVYYPNDLNWKSADEFARKTGEAMKLNGTWRQVGNDDSFSEIRHLQCGDVTKGFWVSAGMRRPPLPDDYGKFPYVQLQDFWKAEMELYKRKEARDERRKREEQERKDTFKP